ncbi:hypothetical protein C8A03DRAFT_33098 [Achaetomium macrosporum]|uniref:DNA/RNA-binding domain-containing protein n=1 Tax=Achaetomium macrosporum TaxID=79813 RepID=A0AAN7CB92_9PEZI|nr:hypothetical protein C8A03DRAFT_33098 [Achaetomium macrosporum]
MPARLWRHGIHSFLELLRHRLPASLEHRLTFIYMAYSMMALLYETVPASGDTWIECLGDLGRYRMAIEDDDVRDRESWSAVSRYWYSRASDKAPITGRLYHHLAILARPNALQQLYYCSKSSSLAIPLDEVRESIYTLFDPILGKKRRTRMPKDASLALLAQVAFRQDRVAWRDMAEVGIKLITANEGIKPIHQQWKRGGKGASRPHPGRQHRRLSKLAMLEDATLPRLKHGTYALPTITSPGFGFSSTFSIFGPEWTVKVLGRLLIHSTTFSLLSLNLLLPFVSAAP